MTEIIVKKGDITKEKADAIVNPANSYGMMGGGVAYAIKRFGGDIIESEAIKKSPIPVGNGVITSAGNLPANFVIHAPTMSKPAEKITLGNVEKATMAALECASKNDIRSVAFPGMGTGVGGIKKEDAARVMIKTIRHFTKMNTNIDKITLIGFDDELAAEFMKWNQKLNQETG